jgi:hypothetical protein
VRRDEEGSGARAHEQGHARVDDHAEEERGAQAALVRDEPVEIRVAAPVLRVGVEVLRERRELALAAGLVLVMGC